MTSTKKEDHVTPQERADYRIDLERRERAIIYARSREAEDEIGLFLSGIVGVCLLDMVICMMVGASQLIMTIFHHYFG